MRSQSAASLPRPSLEAFDGPLDLLLDEVRRQNVAVEKIAMAPIVARFLAYVRAAASHNLVLDIEWLHLAATLIHWKSRSLLPPAAAQESAADPIRDDLVRQLAAHRKETAAELERRGSAEAARFSREAPGGAADVQEIAERPFLSVSDLMRQAREMARWVEERRPALLARPETFGVEPDEVTEAEMIGVLRARLGPADAALDGVSLLNEQPGMLRKSCLFLGMLALAGGGELEMAQEAPFGELTIRRTVLNKDVST